MSCCNIMGHFILVSHQVTIVSAQCRRMKEGETASILMGPLGIGHRLWRAQRAQYGRAVQQRQILPDAGRMCPLRELLRKHFPGSGYFHIVFKNCRRMRLCPTEQVSVSIWHATCSLPRVVRVDIWRTSAKTEETRKRQAGRSWVHYHR